MRDAMTRNRNFEYGSLDRDIAEVNQLQLNWTGQAYAKLDALDTVLVHWNRGIVLGGIDVQVTASNIPWILDVISQFS